MRNKRIYKTDYCKGCIWLSKDGLCPFSGCPVVFGWIADKKAQEGGKNDEKRDC